MHGQLKLVGGAWFDGGRFPRLYHVGGRIYVDNRLFSADWQAGSLVSHSGLFEVQAGVFNPLDGFDKLASVGKLELRNHPNDIYGPFNFSGLNGLQKINSDLEINLEWGSSSGPFLVSLAEVGDDVLITLDDGLFFGMEQLQTIGGNLVVHWNSYGYGNTTGLDKLQSVGGNFEWHGSSISNLAGLASLVSVGGAMSLDYATSNLSGLGSLQSVGSLEIAGSSLQSLAGLENLTSLGELIVKDNYSLGSVAALNNAGVPAAGTIRITNNWNLSECAARTLVRSLRGDPNWSTWNAAGTYVYGNDDCTFTFYRQFKL